MAENKLEIERKFLVTGYPEGFPLLADPIQNQIYLSTKPEVRFRECVNKDGSIVYVETIKGDGDLKRPEKNIPIDKDVYNVALEISGKSPIVKDFKSYLLEDGRILEVSLVDGDFYYAEIEFGCEEEALLWKPSDMLEEYIIKEVTYDKDYKMKNYWLRTRGYDYPLAPLTMIQAKDQMETKGQVEAIVLFKLDEIISGDIEYMNDEASDAMLGNMVLQNISFRPVGADKTGGVYILVSGTVDDKDFEALNEWE